MALVGAANAQTALFQDDFSGGTLSQAWTTRQPSQWVQGGWLYSQDTDGGPRDALVVTHDADTAWSDYDVSLDVQFVPGTAWDFANVVLRANGYARSSAGSAGSGYALQFVGQAGWPPQDAGRIVLDRVAAGLPTGTLASVGWTAGSQPFHVEAGLHGGHITVRVDGALVIDVVDSQPLAAGGLGLHTIWESAARFDNVVVSGVPEPAALPMIAAGLAGVGAWRFGRRQRQAASGGALKP